MEAAVAKKLLDEGLISQSSYGRITSLPARKLISLNWDLRTILYTGITLLTSGLGIVIYNNIDSIGHTAILLFIGALTLLCFYYGVVKKAPFSRQQVQSPDAFFDYIVLLGCLCFIIFIGYWQFQYHIFGARFGLALFVPMTVLFFCAYFFDHLGILSLAITNLAAWAGIAVTPAEILKANDFNSGEIIITASLLGIVLVLAAVLTRKLFFKSHFSFTYTHFGLHILFISFLAGMFHFENIYFLWFLGILIIAWYFYNEAIEKKSFYFLICLTLYTYIGLSYVVIRGLSHTGDGAIYLVFLYFIASGMGLVLFLINRNKKIKKI